ncbi:TonB-dependent receptor [Silvibacterium acidisoli]|uniref:TonB-dependent receptor n=1 Tax=Acidobacteriaceae bacterium ZG23-2 TaxID=2883246 RepID=UPI00406D120F
MHFVPGRIARLILLLPTLLLPAAHLRAVTVHGTVTDSVGRPISGATVALVQNGKILINAISRYDGTFQLTSGATGQFYVVAGGNTFRQLSTESFYGAALDSIAKNIVLEPDFVRQSIVVTDTGTPRPDAEASASVSVIPWNTFSNAGDVVSALRLVPGMNVVQQGQRGALTSIFIRGGNSDSNRVLLDGVPIEDIGGRFDASSISSTGISQIEAYRGPNSVLWGSDAAAGVINFSTPRGSTPFPTFIYEGDLGNFGTYRNAAQLGGTRGKLDYYGAFADLQTKNSIPLDEYHNITSVANIGYALTSATGIRVTAHNADNATGLPGAYQFTGIANDGKQSDQDFLMAGTIDHTFSEFWHAQVRYGMARKREESIQWSPTGNLIDGNYFGYINTIRGANGYEATGQALMNYGGTYPSTLDLVSNRDNLYAQTDYRFTPHVQLVLGFRYEDERGAEKEYAYDLNETLERTNYDYMGAINGDWRQRLFYSVGGGIEKNQLYGTKTSPRVGGSYYIIRPGRGIAHGTRLTFNFAKGVKEPTIDDQFGSLYQFLLQYGGGAAINQYNVRPIGAEESRSYDGGVEQSFFTERVTLRATYFHNEFSNQVEYVPASLIPELLPNLSVEQQQNLQAFLNGESAYELTLNSLAFKAWGVETQLDYGITKNIALRLGYTFLQSQVQRSFSSDAVGPSYNPAYPGIAIGNVSPLVGARPFRRPPNTGSASIAYTPGRFTVVGMLSAASRSDDSTYLGGADLNFGNSLLLPNRDLDHAYAKLDVTATLPLTTWLGVYGQFDNVLSNQHIAPIGYSSLPANARLGLRFTWGHLSKTQ